MASTSDQTTQIPRSHLDWPVWLGAAAAIGVVAALALKTQQDRAIERAAMVVESVPLDPAAKVIRHLRASELITSRIETVVRAQNTDDNWFGSVVATVEAPARLSYGVDLSKLESSRVSFSPIGGVYTLRVPSPKRVATEVFTGQEKVDVELAGLRFRSLAGEAQLGLARAKLHEQALRMRVTGPDLEQIRENTRGEIEWLVKRVVGQNASVWVAFDDEAGTSVAVGQ